MYREKLDLYFSPLCRAAKERSASEAYLGDLTVRFALIHRLIAQNHNELQ